MITPPPPARVCPHCGKVIATLPKKPRDLGLLINFLIYRVPIEVEISEDLIEAVRKHCKMKTERFAELRAGDHARHWPRMLERRAARLAYFKQHGQLPASSAALLPGERDHSKALAGIRFHWKRVRPLVAKMKRRPLAQLEKITNRWKAAERLRSPERKLEALIDLEARMLTAIEAIQERLNVKGFKAAKEHFLPDDTFGPRKRQEGAQPVAAGEK